MINDLKYLWANRYKPRHPSEAVRFWLKRAITFRALVVILFRKWKISRRGGALGRMCVIGECKLQGSLNNLTVGQGASIGRCELILHERVMVGDFAVVNDGVVVLTASHDLDDSGWAPIKRPVTIGRHAWVATNSVLLPGVSIGVGSVVGAGAVVRNDVPDYAIAIGNPSILVKRRRVVDLDYVPAFLNAPVAAWLGPQKSL